MLPLAENLPPVLRVLIIDDEPVNRRLAEALCLKVGCQVAAVASGELGLQHLATSCYDLVLLDISMPGMNGLEVCQRIRATRRLGGLRVIAYTAHAYPEDHAHFLASGFDAVLVKPISRQGLEALLVAQTPGL